MTIKQFQEQIKELIDSGKLSENMQVYHFDGDEFNPIEEYCIRTGSFNAEGMVGLIIDTDF